MIPVLRPTPTGDEIDSIQSVLDSNWWGDGSWVDAVEEEVKAIYNYEHCICVNSCTAALHLAAIVNSVSYGSEVITTPLTFISTALACVYRGARVVFCDIDPKTLCLDWSKVGKLVTRKTRAIISVDYAGFPNVGRYSDIPIIQDAAHSFGSLGYGREICLSFHPVKPVPCGDGGAILTNDKRVASRLRALRWCGINKNTWSRTTSHRYNWDYNIQEIGYKYNWNNIQAAIVLTQLGSWRSARDRRTELAMRYIKELDGLCELPEAHSEHSWHLFVIRVPADIRNHVIDSLASKGIAAGVHYKPLTYYRMFSQCRTPEVVESEWRRLISLPLYSGMTDDEQTQVITALKEIL